MAGFLIVSDVASASQRLSMLLQHEQPQLPLYRASNWEAAELLASEHQLDGLISIQGWHPQNLQGLALIHRRWPKMALIWFVDRIPSSSKPVLQSLGVRALPEEALDTLFSGLNMDVWQSLQT